MTNATKTDIEVPVTVEATMDWTDYSTGAVHVAGEQFELTDATYADALFGIGFIKRVGAVVTPSGGEKKPRRERERDLERELEHEQSHEQPHEGHRKHGQR